MAAGRVRNLGLILFAGLLIVMLGAAISLGAAVPDPGSCASRVSHLILQGEDHPGETLELGRLCSNSRGGRVDPVCVQQCRPELRLPGEGRDPDLGAFVPRGVSSRALAALWAPASAGEADFWLMSSTAASVSRTPAYSARF